MKFTKMQGTGNDYIYVYGTGDRIKDIPALARLMSDRHRGIGADGLILIDPSEKYDFKMRMYNADGSVSPMCGNGSRCVGKYVYDKGYTDKTEIDLETGAGVRHLTLFPEGGRVKQVCVDMGIPVLHSLKIPVDCGAEHVIGRPLHIGNMRFEITCVSMGNPHAVIFVEHVENTGVKEWGPVLENHSFFPEKANIEFIEVVSRTRLKMRVWERGTGETQACGTGACAALVAAVLNKKCGKGVTVCLPGGNLKIVWAENGHVYMTGEAETVFEGEIFIPPFFD